MYQETFILNYTNNMRTIKNCCYYLQFKTTEITVALLLDVISGQKCYFIIL